MASSKLLILGLLVALTLSTNLEAASARRLLNIPGLPPFGGSSTFPMPTLQTPPLLPTIPPSMGSFGSFPSIGTPFSSSFPTSPSLPTIPGFFAPPATTNP